MILDLSVHLFAPHSVASSPANEDPSRGSSRRSPESSKQASVPTKFMARARSYDPSDLASPNVSKLLRNKAWLVLIGLTLTPIETSGTIPWRSRSLNQVQVVAQRGHFPFLVHCLAPRSHELHGLIGADSHGYWFIRFISSYCPSRKCFHWECLAIIDL